MSEPKANKSSSYIKRPLLAGAIAATAVAAAPTHAVDLFLRITGIDGESIQKGHEKEIELLSFQSSFALAKTESVLKLGKPSCGPVAITKNVDTASGPLTDALMKSTPLSKAVFKWVKVGGAGTPEEYYTVTLTNAYVTAVTQISEGSALSETVDFLARGMEISYRPQNQKTGSFGDAIVATVDCAAAAK